MIKLKEILTEAEVSRELWYHIENNISLEECVFRYGSPKYFTIINEARLLACEENINFDNQTRALLETDLGKFGVYEGKEVALDFPMLNEAYSGFVRNPEDPDSEPFEPTGSVSKFREELRALFSKFKGDLKNPDFIKGVAQIMVNWKPLLRSQLDEAIVDYDFSKEELIRVIKQLKRGASTEIGMIKAFEKALGRELTDDEIRGFKLDENKKKKKDPPIGKPKRGGPKAYYVFVRDPKTKRIKKVTFGSGGLRAKINNPKARNAFAKRHRCTTANDRTTARYWSCRLPRYAKQLGIAANNPGGFW
jgi:hypothetical protein